MVWGVLLKIPHRRVSVRGDVILTATNATGIHHPAMALGKNRPLQIVPSCLHHRGHTGPYKMRKVLTLVHTLIKQIDRKRCFAFVQYAVFMFNGSNYVKCKMICFAKAICL